VCFWKKTDGACRLPTATEEGVGLVVALRKPRWGARRREVDIIIGLNFVAQPEMKTDWRRNGARLLRGNNEKRDVAVHEGIRLTAACF